PSHQRQTRRALSSATDRRILRNHTPSECVSRSNTEQLLPLEFSQGTGRREVQNQHALFGHSRVLQPTTAIARLAPRRRPLLDGLGKRPRRSRTNVLQRSAGG